MTKSVRSVYCMNNIRMLQSRKKENFFEVKNYGNVLVKR